MDYNDDTVQIADSSGDPITYANRVLKNVTNVSSITQRSNDRWK